jgi:hypothetical protein
LPRNGCCNGESPRLVSLHLDFDFQRVFDTFTMPGDGLFGTVHFCNWAGRGILATWSKNFFWVTEAFFCVGAPRQEGGGYLRADNLAGIVYGA